MAKTYKILVNDGKGTEIKPVSVVQGAGAKGDPVRMVAKRGWRFELQDDIKGKGLAPDQVRLKRMGKNLAVMFDGSQNADVVIEDFYADNKDDDKDNGMPMLIGQAENGGLYEYVPQDPAASSMPSQLKDGNTPVIASLGGGPLPTDFVLAGLPLVAAGGGLGGWLAGGAAAAAAAAGGGGGGGGAVAVVAALKVRIINDINNDGYINKDELGTATKVSVEVDVPAGAVAGNTINVVSGGSTIPHVLTQAEVDAKKFTLLNAFDKPAEGATITVTASFNNVSASDVAKLDTSAFVDPLDSSKSGLGVSIDSDDNNNGTITKAEFVAPTNASKIRATISLSGDVAVGDVVTVTATGNTDRTFTLTQAQVTAKKIIITDLTPPAEGGSIVVTASIKDEAGNKSPTPNAQDAAVLDTGVPNGGIAPIVEIVTDSGPIPGGDKWVNGPELNGATSFSIKATFDPLKVAIGEKVVFRAVTTISGVPTVESKEVEITQTDLTNGFATVNFALPAKGKNLSVTALIKDSGGNVTDTSLADDASLNDLTAVADANNVTAVANGNTVKIEGNVIAGTSSGAGKDIEYQYSGNDVFITSVKKGTDSSTSFNPLTGANGGTVEAEYGTLTIRADGSYDYVLNSSDKTKALIEGQKVIETFSYKVKDTGGNESDTTLSIEVTGVNDSANVSFKAGSTYSIASNLIRIDTGTDDIVITDVDAGQAKFDGIATIGANFDLRFGLLTLNPAGSASTSTSKGYAVSYVLNNDGNVDVTDVLRHDLFALKSSDGTWKDTLDFVIGSTGAATKQEFHTSTVENLQITAASTSMTDKVVLHGSQLAFDFTAPTSSTDSIEKIDITGTGNNTVKLNLASLTQADAVGGVHKLFVDGNAGDVVNFVHTSIAADTTVAGYNRYVIDSTHELLVQQALSTNFVS